MTVEKIITIAPFVDWAKYQNSSFFAVTYTFNLTLPLPNLTGGSSHLSSPYSIKILSLLLLIYLLPIFPFQQENFISSTLNLPPLGLIRLLPSPPDSPYLPLQLLLFSTQVILTTTTCIAEMLSWPLSTAEKGALAWLYVPYLFFGGSIPRA